MKSAGQIEARLKDEILALWRRRVEDNSRRLPHLCVHNHRQPLDFDKTREGETNEGYNKVDRRHLPMVPSIGICMEGAINHEDWNGTICDDPVDAGCCPLFRNPVTTQDLWNSFTEDLLNPIWVKDNAPVVNALQWVLDHNGSWHFPGWLGTIFRALFPVSTEKLALKPLLPAMLSSPDELGS